MELSSLSAEFFELPVTFKVNGIVQNPTGDMNKWAFPVVSVDPVPADWIAGTWEAVGPPYVALSPLVGVGGKVLAKGSYDIWCWIVDAPENPVRKVGFLKVF